MAADEIVRYTMRTAHVKDGIWMRAKCLVHKDCRQLGVMVTPSGRCVQPRTKTKDIKDLNANFVKHLEKRDEVDGTSHVARADTWRKGLIHGPRAPFAVPYNPDGHGKDAHASTVSDPPLVISLAAARTAETAVANVLASMQRERVAVAAASPASSMSDSCDVYDNRGNKRKRDDSTFW